MDDFFLSTPGNPTSFLVDPWNFHTFHMLSLIPLEILCPHPHFLFVFPDFQTQ